MGYINAPKVCDICGEPFGDVMYDARTFQGPWANMCQSCFKQHGMALGVGLGQKYEWKGDAWEKVK